MNKYLISVITALTFLSTTPVFAEKFLGLDGNPSCVDQPTIDDRLALMKQMGLNVHLRPDAVIGEPTDRNGKLIAAINTVVPEAHLNPKHFSVIMGPSSKDDPRTAAIIIYGDNEGQFCDYMKISADQFEKLLVILNTQEI